MMQEERAWFYQTMERLLEQMEPLQNAQTLPKIKQKQAMVFKFKRKMKTV